MSLALIFVVVAGGIAARAAFQKKSTDTTATPTPVVTLLSLKEYAKNGRTVTANGTVSSLQQVDLKAQATGKITKVAVSLGQKVYTGQTLATIDSGNAAAALTSAMGMLEQARANYNKLLAGASSEQINVTQKSVDAAQAALDSANTSLATTKAQQDTAVQNALTTLLNTPLTATPGTSNLDTAVPTITGSLSGIDQGSYKITLYQTGIGMKFQTSGLESVIGDVKTQAVPLGTKGLLIQFPSGPAVSDTWTIAIPNTSSPLYTANNNAYETSLRTRDSAIAAAQAQVVAATSALAQAKASLIQQQAQARPADVQAAQASITSAQGQVQAAQVAYRNTLVQAPFDGTVSALPVKTADVVSNGQLVATVVNQGGLQVKVFLSNDDLKFVAANFQALIGTTNATGTVTNVASSVDPNSKTGEVDIAISSPATSGLTVGQNVSVSISGSTGQGSSSILLPIQTVKFTPDGKAFVYTLSKDNKAEEVAVTTGSVQGETVEITGGINPDQSILSNAYAVSAGDSVQIQK